MEENIYIYMKSKKVAEEPKIFIEENYKPNYA
jgi:hypothetical protein